MILGEKRLDLYSLWRNHNSTIVLSLFAIAFLVVGFLIVTDFGLSFDENEDAAFGQFALNAYSNPNLTWSFRGDRIFYGPAYFMLQGIVGPALDDLVADWTLADTRHFLNYLSFLLGGFALYYIMRQFVVDKAALIATLLFLTQPLFFGHAFINGKDVPFMSAFLVSIACGMYAISRFPSGNDTPGELPTPSDTEPSRFHRWLEELSFAPKRRRVLIFITAIIIVLAYAELFILKLLILPLIQNLVTDAYFGQSIEPINTWFAETARFAGVIPVSNYIEKATRLYQLGRALLLILAIMVFLALFASVSKQSIVNMYRQHFLPSLKTWIRSRYLLVVLIGGATVGMSSAMRVFGLLAGVLITIAYIGKYRCKSLMSLLVYWASALLMLILLWPYLWSDPLERFIESLVFMAYHPWGGEVLYAGILYEPRALPWHYLPWLITVQFTLPIILLALLGFGVIIVRSRSTPPAIHWRVIFIIWFALPLVLLIIRDPTLYDNFRQFLFVTPVLFILGAFGIELIFQHLRGRVAQVVFTALVLLPGVVSLIRLHPYQYIYYNELVGGVQGASRRYELDYWCTAYKETTEFANENLPEGSTIAFWNNSDNAELYAADHIHVRKFWHSQYDEVTVDYIAQCTRANLDLVFLPDAEVIHEVQVEGIPLVVIKKTNNNE